MVQEINNKAVKLNDPLYANKTYIDAQDATKVNKSGDTMSGNLAMGGNKVTGLGTTSASTDAATKQYVDDNALLYSGSPGFTQDGTGAVTRSWSSKLKDIVSVKDFGVVGNGTDETAKVQAALNYLNSIGGGELHFNGEVVRCDSQLVGYTNTAIVGTPGSTIDWSYRSTPFNSPGDEGLLVFRGTAGSEILLSANAVYGTNKISVPNASVFTEGDLVEVSMNSQGSFPDTSVATKSGQLNILTGVYTSTNTLVLDTEIFEPLNYTTVNGARIRKITPVQNVLIEGITFKGFGRPTSNTVADLGIRIFFGRNTTIRNCNFLRLDTKALEVISCHHFVIDNNEFYHDKMGDTNDTISYAISYSSSQYGSITNNKIVNCRQGIVSSHLSSALSNKYYGISRFIVIDSNFVTGNYGDLESAGWAPSHAGISTHSDVEFIEIINNIVTGCRYGINPRTWNITISNNRLVNNASAGVYFSGNFRDIIIQGNYISDSIGITQAASTETELHPGMRILNNIFSKTSVIYFASDTSNVSTGFEFSGNVVKDNTSTGVAAVWVNGAFTGKIENNLIDNVPSASAGLRLEYLKSMLITRNIISRTSRSIQVSSACPKTMIIGNSFITNTLPMNASADKQVIVSANNDFGTAAF